MMNYLNKYGVNRCSVVTTTLLLLIYVSATLDTHLFVYPSLSRTLIPELLILLLTTTALLYCIVKKRNFINSKETWFVLIWVAYIIIHYASVYPHEQYRTMYLVVSLLLIPTVSFVLHHNLISRSQCENIVLFVAIIQIIFVLAQWTGLIASGNIYFTLTGSNENPTATSLYLVGCVPIISARLYRGDNRKLYFSVVLLCLITIGALRCRTAYIGLSVELLIAIAIYLKKHNISMSKSFRFPFLFVLILMVTSIGFKLYDMKRDSADGRILIWKLSSKMIIEKPQGYGYGLFEKNYNLRQAEYFAEGKGTETEVYHSNYIFMPYNDYLEHGVEGGIVGLLFLLFFYVMMTMKAIRKKELVSLSIILSFCIMSFTNFVYSSIQSWLLLMTVSAFVLTDGKPSTDNRTSKYTHPSMAVDILLLLATIVFLWQTIHVTRSQMRLAQYHKEILRDGYIAENKIANLQPDIGTSEAYWNLSAYSQLLSGNHAIATEHLDRALVFTSSPQTLHMAYAACRQSGNENKGIGYIRTWHDMLPMMLTPKLLLMEHNAQRKDSAKASYYANEIINTPHKIDSDKTEHIRHKARLFLSKQAKDMKLQNDHDN